MLSDVKSLKAQRTSVREHILSLEHARQALLDSSIHASMSPSHHNNTSDYFSDRPNSTPPSTTKRFPKLVSPLSSCLKDGCDATDHSRSNSHTGTPVVVLVAQSEPTIPQQLSLVDSMLVKLHAQQTDIGVELMEYWKKRQTNSHCRQDEAESKLLEEVLQEMDNHMRRAEVQLMGRQSVATNKNRVHDARVEAIKQTMASNFATTMKTLTTKLKKDEKRFSELKNNQLLHSQQRYHEHCEKERSAHEKLEERLHLLDIRREEKRNQQERSPVSKYKVSPLSCAIGEGGDRAGSMSGGGGGLDDSPPGVHPHLATHTSKSNISTSLVDAKMTFAEISKAARPRGIEIQPLIDEKVKKHLKAAQSHVQHVVEVACQRNKSREDLHDTNADEILKKKEEKWKKQEKKRRDDAKRLNLQREIQSNAMRELCDERQERRSSAYEKSQQSRVHEDRWGKRAQALIDRVCGAMEPTAQSEAAVPQTGFESQKQKK